MPDYAGAYAWIKDHDSSLVGGMIASRYGWSAKPNISDGLHDKFCDWQELFEQHDEAMDWEGFHLRGLQLSFWLKDEVGAALDVVYQKPYEDPQREIDERRLIKADGSFEPMPSSADLRRRESPR